MKTIIGACIAATTGAPIVAPIVAAVHAPIVAPVVAAIPAPIVAAVHVPIHAPIVAPVVAAVHAAVDAPDTVLPKPSSLTFLGVDEPSFAGLKISTRISGESISRVMMALRCATASTARLWPRSRRRWLTEPHGLGVELEVHLVRLDVTD